MSSNIDRFCHYIKDIIRYNYSMTLQNDVKNYVRKARKIRGQILSFEDYNSKYHTNLPTGDNARVAFQIFETSLKSARKKDGYPVTRRLFNLYKALSNCEHAVITPIVKKELIPPPSISLKPVSSRSLSISETYNEAAKTLIDETYNESILTEEDKIIQEAKMLISEDEEVVSVEKEKYTIEHFKNDLNEWIKKNPKSKLAKETQVVYFVGHEKVENPEHFASKLTRSTGQILETGGIFKMRSGMKKEILGMDKDAAKEIIDMVTKGGKGPFFLSMACNTGALNCKCH